MLALHPSSSSKPLSPNLLPCKISHNGPISISKRHWSPRSSPKDSNTSTAYLRGRKLKGRVVKLPAGYEGVILQKTDKILPVKPAGPVAGEEDEEEEEPIEVKIMEKTGTFDSITIWGHEAVPDGEDVYVKGIEEWIGFAESIHAYDTPASTTETESKAGS